MTEQGVATRNRRLLAWYAEHGRDLPWRRTREPWPILVSEVMAQQTQLARVVPAFTRFLGEFPSPADLAAAEVGKVIELWGGLGYQRRALDLRRSAQRITSEGWPNTVEGLLRLPGVGPYTAAAVACFAFGEPVPAPDVNHRRVLSRWTGSLLGSQLPQVAAGLMERSRAAEWNQAVMDLGALLCRPRRPRCGQCPVAASCADPTIEVGGRRQSPYEGSVRQARAAVLRTLAAGPLLESELAERVEAANGTLRRALADLQAEGVVERANGRIELSTQD